MKSMKKNILFLALLLAAPMHTMARTAKADAGRLELEINTMITSGPDEEVVLPQENYCVQAIYSPIISGYWPRKATYHSKSGSAYTLRDYVDVSGVRTCSIPALIKTASGKTLRLYRDVKTQLLIKESVRSVEGGLGLFGALLNTVSFGLSNALFSSVDQLTSISGLPTNLQTNFTYALSIRTPEPVLQNDLIILQCQIEAAQLARQACTDAKLIDQNAYYTSLRNTYLSFMTKYSSPVKRKK